MQNLLGNCRACQESPRKARDRDLAKFDGNRLALGMLNPLRDKNEGAYRGEEGTTLVIAVRQEAGV